MTTSNSTDFEPNVTEFVEEAYARCGLELRTGYDLKTAKRSINLMLAEWANRGLNQWTIQQKTVAMVLGTTSYNVDTTNSTAAIDVLDAFMRQTTNDENIDIQMTRLSRSESRSLRRSALVTLPAVCLLRRIR